MVVCLPFDLTDHPCRSSRVVAHLSDVHDQSYCDLHARDSSRQQCTVSEESSSQHVHITSKNVTIEVTLLSIIFINTQYAQAYLKIVRCVYI